MFLRFFHEALRFLKCAEDLVEVCFEDYSYIRIPSTLKAREMYYVLHSHEVGSLEKVDEIVRKEGFKLGDNRWPEFEEEILNEYYAESLKAWEEFCSDIYFSGAEDYFMKKAMLELPQKSEYWHAFYKN